MSCNHDWFDHYMMYSAFNAGRTGGGGGGFDGDGCFTVILFIVGSVIGLFAVCMISIFIDWLFDFILDMIRQFGSLFI